MWGGLEGFHANIDGVYLGTVCCESEDMVQRSSRLQVRTFAIPFRCFMGVDDINVQGGHSGEVACQPAV